MRRSETVESDSEDRQGRSREGSGDGVIALHDAGSRDHGRADLAALSVLIGRRVRGGARGEPWAYCTCLQGSHHRGHDWTAAGRDRTPFPCY